MKSKIIQGTLVLVMGMALAAVWPDGYCALHPATARPAADQPATTRPVVVLELFTSEGCSDCPPADRLLAQLVNQPPLAGVEIIPLSEHVTYWNQQGWTDPFSSLEFTERQRDYSGSLHLEVYTPQMVVDGKVGFVGADSGEALKAITEEARAPKADVRIEPVASSGKPGQQAFSINVEKLPPLEGKKKVQVFLAITENGLSSAVAAGENAGQTLKYTGVVRELKSIGTFEPRTGATFSAQPRVALSKEWKRNELRAVVLVQVQGAHRILGAAETTFPAL